MEKWIISHILLFLLFLSTKNASAREVNGLLSNFLFEEPMDEAQCDQMQLEVAALNSAMTFDNFPRLHGKWVSQECEVRPGPEFLLRSYFFTKNHSFRLLQHYYEDESCILPSHTVIAKGELGSFEPSWVTPSGTEYEYTLNRVTVIPHTTKMAEKLSSKIKQKCGDQVNNSGKPHQEYVILNSRDFEKRRKPRKHSRYQRKKLQRDIDCLAAVAIEFNELMLIRTQWRSTEDGKKSRELLLGDISSEIDTRFVHKPTAFQVPLLKNDQVHDCINCQLISKGTERAPPHLSPKPQLPPLPHGQWISQRCEVRPLGMFLTRKLSFDSKDRTWIGEYRFYADPFCTETTFVISASGSYLLGPIQDTEKIIRKKKTGTSFDYRIEEASLTLYDPTLKDTFNSESNCGIGTWALGVPKDLGPTFGCSVLGVVLPTTEYELIKLEIDKKGTPLLFMGLPDTKNKKRSYKNRPTSYQAPLAQCSAFPRQTAINDLAPIYYARRAPRSSAQKQSPVFFFVFGSVSIFIFLYFSNIYRKIQFKFFI